MSEDNVISLFGKKNDEDGAESSKEKFDFDQVMRTNEMKKKKMAKERSQHNKSVKRSYKLDR
jgi:hypothetical protein